MYPPPGSQQMYPPQGSQFAPPPGPPPGSSGPVGTAPPTGPGAPTPNVRRQSSGMGSVEALAKRMSMSLTHSSPSHSAVARSSLDHQKPFADNLVQSPTLMHGDGGGHNAFHAQHNPFTSDGPVRQGSVGRTSARTEEDPLTLLKSFDCVFIVDDSGSMHLADGDVGPSRWEEARDALAGVVELARHYDDDGVDIYFLNSEERLQGTRDPDAVRRLFDSINPDGPTPTGERLEMLLLEYWDTLDAYTDRKKRGALTPGEKAPKKLNIVVITDGCPSDEPADVIVSCARRLDEGRYPLAQIGIQFLQVGNDSAATSALIALDDELNKVHKVRDMVDTTTYAGMQLSTSAITKALLGGINRRLDRQADPMQQQQALH